MSEVQRSPDDCLKCGINYAGYQSAASRKAGSSDKPKSKSLAILIFAIAIVAGLAFGGYKGYLHYQRQQFIADADSYVRGTTIHLQQMVETMRNPGSITFQELFNKSAKSIEEIDGFIVKVSMLDGQQDVKDGISTYMKAVQDALRGITAVNRGFLEFSAANDRIERSRATYIETTNEYASDYAKNAWDEAIDDSADALKKVKEAKDNLNDSLALVRSASESLIWFSPESKPNESILKDI